MYYLLVEYAPLPILILIFVFSFSIGFLLTVKPSLAIEIQRRVYEKINWRIEPISMSKEIRNTKIMGVLLIVITLAAIIYMLIATK